MTYNPRSPSLELIAALRQMRGEGLSFVAIGRATGRSKGQIAGLCRRHLDGIKTVYVPYVKRKPVPWVPRKQRAPVLPVLGACCWLMNDGRPWIRCDGPVTTPGPYCELHRKRAYMPLSETRRAQQRQEARH
jgi:hypothetical protein